VLKILGVIFGSILMVLISGEMEQEMAEKFLLLIILILMNRRKMIIMKELALL
jgi:hypothetical protein